MNTLTQKNQTVTALLVAAYATVIAATRTKFDAEVKRDRAFAKYIGENAEFKTVTAAKSAFELAHPNFHRTFEEATIDLTVAELELSSAKAERDGLANEIRIEELSNGLIETRLASEEFAAR